MERIVLMKKLGIIGGLGPLATAYFYKLITDFTEIEREQEHLEILIHSCPSIPDRTSHILDPENNPSPLPKIEEIGRELASAGCSVIAVPCVTAHCFFDDYSKSVPAQFIHMPKETAKYLASEGIGCAGIMATDGTLKTGVLASALEEYGIKPVRPSAKSQKNVMKIIYEQVKLGNPIDYELFDSVGEDLRSQGAQTVILGCTELSLARSALPDGYIDVLEVLASRSIEACGAHVREEYKKLI